MTAASATPSATALTAAALKALREPIGRLVDSSRRNFQNPYETVDWPEVVDPHRDWFFSPELSSLYGTDLWSQLGEPKRRRVAFLEALNFFSLNIHGERELMAGLVARLYRPDMRDVAPYLHHFIDEENKHSVYFGTFCTRYGSLYRSRQIAAAPVPATPDGDLRFFAKVLVFEEIVDRFNVAQAKDERLHPVARFINHNHHAEETRHLIFGRKVVEELWKAHGPTWSADQVDDLRRYLAQFYVMAWREYYNPDVYRDAGFDASWELAEQLWASPAQQARRRGFSQRSARFLIDCGILTEEPDAAY
jgi:P-aminobenzoate N-oxygenase AurF